MVLYIIRGERMKGEKTRIVIIYVLILLIIALVGALIYVMMSSQKSQNKITDKPQEESNEISEKCIFDITAADYAKIIGGDNSAICGALNQFNITDIALNGQPLGVKIIYNNGVINESDKDTGIYINDNLAIKHASTNYINNLGVFDNKLFVYAHNANEANVMAYNSMGDKVYDLGQTLAVTKITDQILADLAKTNEGLKVIVDTTNIDKNNVQFAANEFTFATNSGLECQTGMYSGSIYKVTFTGEEFAAPQFVNFVSCPVTQ